MNNTFAIYIGSTDKDTVANLEVNYEFKGSITCPNNTLNDKKDWIKFLTSLAGVVYGEENKAKQESQSYSKIIEDINAKKKRKQENLSQK
jgi:hypothetical protein